MTGMVEKLARALAQADGFHPEAVSNDCDSQPAWKLYVSQSRAALEAMREPTEEMVKYAEEHSRDPAYSHDRTDWQAMIDAALKENKA